MKKMIDRKHKSALSLTTETVRGLTRSVAHDQLKGVIGGAGGTEPSGTKPTNGG